MRKLVIVLALTSVAFAGHRCITRSNFGGARASGCAHRNFPGIRGAASPVVGSQESPPAAQAKPGAAPREAPAFISGTLVNWRARIRSRHEAHAGGLQQRFLAQISDPEQREELLAERKMMMRNTYPRIAQVLGLTPEEHARLIELYALQQLDMQEASSRCTLDPACDLQQLHRQLGETRTQEINNLLGAERMDKFNDYKNTMGERESVSQLRTRLPDTQRLSDDKAESLITALAEERDAIYRQLAQQGSGTHSFGIGAGMIITSSDGGSFEGTSMRPGSRTASACATARRST